MRENSLTEISSLLSSDLQNPIFPHWPLVSSLFLQPEWMCAKIGFMENSEPVIVLNDVSAAYQEKIVLESVNLEVTSGTFMAIIGPNGAGKSTLLKLILGLIKPARGEVKVFGVPAMKKGEHRHRIGYVPQLLSMDLKFPMNVEDAVIMGRYGRIGLFKNPGKSDKKLAGEAMEKVAITDLAKRPLARLSGGQLQRVLLARALANEPELLLLDEPTSGVDSTTTFNLYEILGELHKEHITILLVSHDVGVVASFVDGVACLNKRLIIHGKPNEVLGSNELEEMYGCHAMFFHHGNIPHMVVEND